MPEPIRLVALISGGGTTLQNLIDRIADRRLAARIVGVVSSRGDAFGVERAKRAGLPVIEVPKASGGRQAPVSRTQQGPDGPRSPAFSDRVWSAVRAFDPQLVCFAG